MLLRRVIGDALRARRQAQHRTLREVSGAANVSLGYLSEIERGQKEASSELLASICDALGAQLSEVFREVSDTFALAEQVSEAMSPAVPLPVTVPVTAVPVSAAGPDRVAADLVAGEAAAELVSVAASGESIEELVDELGGVVTVTVHHAAPLKTTLRTVRNMRPMNGRDLGGRELGDRERDVVYN